MTETIWEILTRFQVQYFVRKLLLKIYNSIYLLVVEVQKKKLISKSAAHLNGKDMTFYWFNHIDLITVLDISKWSNSSMRIHSREELHEFMWWKSYFAQHGNHSLQSALEMKYLSVCDSLLGISPSAMLCWRPASSLPTVLGRWAGRLGCSYVYYDKSASSYDTLLYCDSCQDIGPENMCTRTKWLCSQEYLGCESGHCTSSALQCRDLGVSVCYCSQRRGIWALGMKYHIIKWINIFPF